MKSGKHPGIISRGIIIKKTKTKEEKDEWLLVVNISHIKIPEKMNSQTHLEESLINCKINEEIWYKI